jgi:hypothetical protein
MVFLQYDTDSFVTVLYHHDTDSGNFHKNQDPEFKNRVYLQALESRLAICDAS